MTAPATQDDPAPSIVKSALSVVALKIQKKNLSKNFCNDICVPPFYSLFTPMVKCSSKYTLFLTLCQDTWDLHSSICRQCLHPNKQGLRIKEFYDLALFPNCVKFKTFCDVIIVKQSPENLLLSCNPQISYLQLSYKFLLIIRLHVT